LEEKLSELYEQLDEYYAAAVPAKHLAESCYVWRLCESDAEYAERYVTVFIF